MKFNGIDYICRPRQSASFDVERHEFLCPLCKGLSNAVLPILPNRSASVQRPLSNSGAAATTCEAGQADMATLLEGLTILAEIAQEHKYGKSDGHVLHMGPTADFNVRMDPVKAEPFWNVLTMRPRPRIASTLKNMASLFVQSVYTVSDCHLPAACTLLDCLISSICPDYLTGFLVTLLVIFLNPCQSCL